MMERTLVKIALSPQQTEKLNGQEILIYDQKIWLWMEVLFFPTLLLIYLGYILPFRNSFTIIAFGILIVILFFPFLSAKKRLKINAPVLRMNDQGLSFHAKTIPWSAISAGLVKSGLFGDELVINTSNGEAHHLALMHLTRSTSQIHVLLCKYYSLPAE